MTENADYANYEKIVQKKFYIFILKRNSQKVLNLNNL